MLVKSDGRACVADFGLSTLLTQLGGSTFATTYRAKGTVRWMAPELLDPEDDSETTPTTKTDVYSFGSIMLQVHGASFLFAYDSLKRRKILTGNIPYHYLTRDEQVIFAIVKGVPPKRPDEVLVTEHRWKFIEWCWSPAKGTKPRPSGDEIVQFTEQDLSGIIATGV